MTKNQIELGDFLSEYVAVAHNLSQQVSWPHRQEDWAMMVGLSDGVVALAAEQVVGTALATKFGDDAATINMVIVDENLRGKGVGRQLMEAALKRAEGRECRLVATAEGLPLYQKLGFEVTGEIVQLQGIAEEAEAPTHVSWATAADADAIGKLDQQGSGLDRSKLLDWLQSNARLAVLRKGDVVVGYAGLRAFGRGEVVGPIISSTAEDAVALAAFMFQERKGHFIRVDTPKGSGLEKWLSDHGLKPAGGGIVMAKDIRPAGEENSDQQVFALASQALC